MFTHKGYEIEINSSGQFSTTIDTLQLSAKSLEELHAKIDREIGAATSKKALSLPVLVLVDGPRESARRILGAVLTGINRTDRSLMLTGLPKGWSSRTIVPNTVANRVALEEWVEAEKRHEVAGRRLQSVLLGREDMDWENRYGRIEDETLEMIASAHARKQAPAAEEEAASGQ